VNEMLVTPVLASIKGKPLSPKEKILSFCKTKGVDWCEGNEGNLVTEEAYDYSFVFALYGDLVAAKLVAKCGDEDSELPKIFLLSPLSGDMCKYKLEIDF